MDKATREKKELLINHLVTERNKVEDACGGKPHDDIKKVYNMISRTIAELKMEVFMILTSKKFSKIDFTSWYSRSTPPKI